MNRLTPPKLTTINEQSKRTAVNMQHELGLLRNIHFISTMFCHFPANVIAFSSRVLILFQSYKRTYGIFCSFAVPCKLGLTHKEECSGTLNNRRDDRTAIGLIM